jgi:hypothetical protein
VVLKLGIDASGVAYQYKAHVRVPDERERSGRDHHAWAVVPAHGVERYGDWSTHSCAGPENNT